MKKQLKKMVSLSIAMLMVFSFTSCGTKKKDTASGVKAEIESTEEMAKLQEEETEIILEMSKETTIIDECGNEISVEEGEELVVVEKTTDEAGDSVYILDNGSIIKENVVSEVATEKITAVETTKENVLKNESKKENTSSTTKKTDSKTTTTNKTESETKTEKQTTAKQETQEQTTVKQTQAQTQPTTQKQTTTKKETTTVQQTTVPQTTQPATTKPQETTTEPPTVQEPTYVGYREDLDMKAKQLILDERVKAGANANPTWNEHLYKVAKARAKEIVTDYSHNSIGGYRDGYNVSEAIMKAKLGSKYTPEDVAVSSWINSPSHYDILLSGDQFAVASYQVGDYMYWVCITATEFRYIAENYADYLAKDWGSKYEEKYEKYYNSFVLRYGERKIW